MFYRLRRWLGVQEQSWLRRVRETPPLGLNDDGPVFVSQIAGIFVDMYLLAVKSLGTWVTPSRVIALDDGTITTSAAKLLASHIPGIEIRPVAGVPVGRCPKLGTWERLLTCVDESARHYVIQVDSDTVTTRRPDAVLDAFREGRCFTMSGHVTDVSPEYASRKLTLEEAYRAREAELRTNEKPHIQIVSETSLRSIPALDGTVYARGCSGFAGFAPRTITRDDVSRFSVAMEGEIGARWHEWGTEQVTSNYVIANAPGSVVLPWPEYVSIMEPLDEERAHLIHFSGAERYARGVYERASRKALEQYVSTPVASRSARG